MNIKELIEARREPQYNTRRYTRSVLADRLVAVKDAHDYVAGIPNLFVNFSDIEKLGINPRREHTLSYLPLGIYAYPAEWLVNHATIRHEFAGQRPWANIFQIQGPVLNIATIAPSEASQLLNQAKHMIRQLGWDAEITYQSWDDNWVSQFHRLAIDYLALLWDIHPQVAMHKLWRSMNIDAIVDPGTRLLARDIGAQLIVFNREIITNNEQIRNVYREPTVTTGEQFVQTVVDELMPKLNELNQIFARDRSGWLKTLRTGLSEFSLMGSNTNAWITAKRLEQYLNELVQTVKPTEPDSQLVYLINYEINKALRLASVQLGLK